MDAVRKVTIGTLALMLVLASADLMAGGTHISILHPSEADILILLKLRLPRMLTSVLAGASLSVAGLQMQSLFRNPLSDPHIMGVSSGASVAAAIVAMALPVSASVSIPLAAAAFTGALLTSLLVMAVSSRVSNSGTLLLFGVMLGYILSAVVSIVQYGASEKALKYFYNWSAGSFIAASWPQISILAVLMSLSVLLAFFNAKGLDILLFGDEFALVSGVSPKKVRIVSLLSCCLVTGAVTAFCGPLGFVGIVAPHIARRLCGTAVHSRVILPSMLTGAVVALLADMISLLTDSPMPVGSAMALVGIPVVMFILLKSREGGRV